MSIHTYGGKAERKRKMKKLLALAFALLLAVSAFAVNAAAEDVSFSEGESYNVCQILGREPGSNGFTFYAKWMGSDDMIPCVNKEGQYESRNWVVEDENDPGLALTARYWENDVQGENSYFWIYPSLGEMIIEFKAPITGKVSFDIEACLQEDPTEEENGVSIIFEREDGTKLADDLDVIKAGKFDYGMARYSAKDVRSKFSFEINKDEKVYIRFNNKGVGGNDQMVCWFKMAYMRLGDAPETTTETPQTSGEPVGTTTDSSRTSAPVTDNGKTTTDGDAGTKDNGGTMIIIIAAAVVAVIVVAVVVVAVKKKKK